MYFHRNFSLELFNLWKYIFYAEKLLKVTRTHKCITNSKAFNRRKFFIYSIDVFVANNEKEPVNKKVIRQNIFAQQ